MTAKTVYATMFSEDIASNARQGAKKDANQTPGTFPLCRHDAKYLRAILFPEMPSPSPSTLQRIYDAMRYLVTNGHGTLPAEVRRGSLGYAGPQCRLVMDIRRLLETVTLEDLNLDGTRLERSVLPQLLASSQYGGGSILFWNIVQTEAVSMVVFGLPRGVSFKLHTHPGMIVLTKALYGSFHVVAGSLLSPPPTAGHQQESRDGTNIVQETASANVPLDLPIFDYGAVPGHYEARSPGGPVALDNCSAALWKHIVQGSRRLVNPRETVELLELFNGRLPSSQQAPRRLRPELESLDASVTTSLYPSKRHDWRSTAVCTPLVGNVHRLTSASDFAVLLDVISPPYDIPESRGCDHFIASMKSSLPSRSTVENRLVYEVTAATGGGIAAGETATGPSCNFVEFDHPPPPIDLRIET